MKNHKQILIIEQDRVVGLDLQLQLKKNGFSVDRPISIDDAEISISQNKPDLIIADTNIKKQNIFERIKINLKKFQRPMIWIGTITNKETAKCSKGINLIGVFSKPFECANIVKLIVKYFNEKINSIFRRNHVTN